MSRRRLVTWGAAGMAGAALPLVTAGTASADPVPDNVGGGPVGRVFDVTHFGARGDGVTINTDAINRAIERGGQRRRHGLLPGRHLRQLLDLPTVQRLPLPRPERHTAGRHPGQRPRLRPGQPGAGNPYQDFGHSHWHNSLIWGENLTDIAIGGPGTIDGRGLIASGNLETAPLQGNKILALKLCRNVVVRDITMVNGGHFCILPTGVDNFRIDNVVIDTNRDGIDIDCCKNVRISNTTVNSPNDDGIVLKSSYALNEVRDTENVTIDNCLVSGYDLGTLVDGTFKTGPYGRTGRIKCGTESNGGFKNIAISNIIFEYCRGLALETVDGGQLQDITISNITMRNVQMPIFLRLGARMRGPAGIPIGTLSRVSISNVVAHNADPRYPSCIAGIPGHNIEDIRISDVRHHIVGGLTPGDAVADPPELVDGYPEPTMFGTLPAFGFFIRHADRVTLDNVEVRFDQQDTRTAFDVVDVTDIDFHHTNADKVTGSPTFTLDDVDQFMVTTSRPVPDTRLAHVDHDEL